jgi:predicted TIM-barrel enzyme
MACVVAPGTPGSTSAESRRLVENVHDRPIAEADNTLRLTGCATGLAGILGASSMERLPTEVAITDSMRRFTLLAHVATAS